MAELSMPVTAGEIARYYNARYPGLITGFVIDEADVDQIESITNICPVKVAPTVMRSLEDKKALASDVLAFATELQQKTSGAGLSGARP